MWNINVYHNLEKLELNLCCTRRIDLLTVTPVLHSCPLLQEFHLAVNIQTLEFRGYKEHVRLHPQLKKVYISGFGGTQNEIGFASYVMKSAIMLQKLHISAHASHYLGNGVWSDRVRPALKRNKCRYIRSMLRRGAVSKTADVVIQLASLRKWKIFISEDDN
ncbi:hypothetical protein PHJA_002363000 [Phtheirospermum japonicum]|uniref:FBD domain-containing protein n=1 Tax=Phtheirospermum japonicum TaxID=374723 RepID=A0A830CQK4_9LAMI|nr:hypothetical protein PHJA_002363000 [Phtheirospermum japonicum]